MIKLNGEKKTKMFKKAGNVWSRDSLGCIFDSLPNVCTYWFSKWKLSLQVTEKYSMCLDDIWLLRTIFEIKLHRRYSI